MNWSERGRGILDGNALHQLVVFKAGQSHSGLRGQSVKAASGGGRSRPRFEYGRRTKRVPLLSWGGRNTAATRLQEVSAGRTSLEAYVAARAVPR